MQVGFVEGQFAALHREPAQAHFVVGRHDGGRGVLWHRVDDLRDEFGNTVEPGGGEADDGIHPARHFFEQYKGVAAALRAARTAGATGAGRGGFAGLGGVGASGDGFLQLLDVRQLRLARRGAFSGDDVGHLVAEQVGTQLQLAATAEGQFLAVLQAHGHRAGGAGIQRFPGKQPVALDQGALGTVARHCVNLTHYLTDDTDERCHIHSSAADSYRHLRMQRKREWHGATDLRRVSKRGTNPSPLTPPELPVKAEQAKQNQAHPPQNRSREGASQR